MCALFHITAVHFNINKTNVWLVYFLLINKYNVGDEVPVHEYIIWINSMHQQFKEYRQQYNITPKNKDEYNTMFTDWLDIKSKATNEVLS